MRSAQLASSVFFATVWVSHVVEYARRMSSVLLGSVATSVRMQNRTAVERRNWI